jgi:hypothetical protein
VGAGVVTTERRFGLEEARALLPELRERLPRIREHRAAMIAASHRLTERLERETGGVAEPEVFRAQRALRAELEWFAEQGIVLRDPDSGLVDFPAVRDGEEVYWCWLPSEADIGFFHPVTTGFGGRRPL